MLSKACASPLLSIQVQIQISPGSLTDGNYIPPLFSSSSLVGLIQTGQCPSCCCPAQALRNGVRSGDANCGGNLRDIELRSQGRRVRCSIWAILASHPSKAGPKKKAQKTGEKESFFLSPVAAPRLSLPPTRSSQRAWANATFPASSDIQSGLRSSPNKSCPRVEASKGAHLGPVLLSRTQKNGNSVHGTHIFGDAFIPKNISDLPALLVLWVFLSLPESWG